MIPWIGLATAALFFVEPSSPERARLDSLADATTASIARFADRRVAIAEGYRRIGTDFPSMGEHWLHPAALLGGRLDPSRPTVLAYATIDGTPTLLGVGFIVTTRGSAVSDAPGWPTYWHEHSGAIADESGSRVGAADPSPDATHVWVLHIWDRLPNPLGRYDSDNWALPFARAGIPVPEAIDHDMARALSLTVGAGDAYLRQVLIDAGLRTEANAATIDAVIARERGAALAISARARVARRLSEADSDALRAVWRSLGSGLEELLGSTVRPVLAPPHKHHEH